MYPGFILAISVSLSSELGDSGLLDWMLITDPPDGVLCPGDTLCLASLWVELADTGLPRLEAGLGLGAAGEGLLKL